MALFGMLLALLTHVVTVQGWLWIYVLQQVLV
ncbi:hypothetical protein HDA36_000823 [Nocardiopsis composta]|uniref:Uncharacterized protein n=1 Tax=Nocardiopsis composta TaxID=157465 RepID=A0A7W8QIR7_9ACTN|nr:hypothetical protein [Nocardiopsis composta]